MFTNKGWVNTSLGGRTSTYSHQKHGQILTGEDDTTFKHRKPGTSQEWEHHQSRNMKDLPKYLSQL